MFYVQNEKDKALEQEKKEVSLKSFYIFQDQKTFVCSLFIKGKSFSTEGQKYNSPSICFRINASPISINKGSEGARRKVQHHRGSPLTVFLRKV